MSNTRKDAQSALTAEVVIQKFFDRETSPVELGWLFHDMLMRYLRPDENWSPSREHAQYVIDNADVIGELLRNIGEMRAK